MKNEQVAKEFLERFKTAIQDTNLELTGYSADGTTYSTLSTEEIRFKIGLLEFKASIIEPKTKP